ncbi:type II toxin-antitoxin system death-on-curing family toxin [Amphibacillus sp. Q70]|uniref:type II toxin-antitoxin system death-on-curing family toxin n=1 Tax=Amphibacillus sp. Q70 TaxID=3453416 RepID=UPI003F84ED41
MMRYLSSKEVIAINTFVIKKYSPDEPLGVKDHALLESAVKGPQTTVGGEDAYQSLFEKAAALFESIALNHAFINGNKRTALHSLAIFLRYNGYNLNMETDQKVDFTVNVVLHHYSFTEIASIIQKYSVKI